MNWVEAKATRIYDANLCQQQQVHKTADNEVLNSIHFQRRSAFVKHLASFFVESVFVNP